MFLQVLEHPSDQRQAFLTQVCGQEHDLYDEVGSLLRAHEEATGFLDRPFARLGGNDPQADAGQDSDEWDLPRRLGPYELQSLLGRGGMGAVYLATRADDTYRGKVAIKVLRRDLAGDELARRLRNERQILADLRHPNIARLLDGGTIEDGQPYLVMEYVEGEPFDRYCDRLKLPVRQRLALMRKVCAAVHAAHQNLVVHRDLKSANILLTADGEPKLLDFGIAKLLHPGDPLEDPAMTVAGLAPMQQDPDWAADYRATRPKVERKLGHLMRRRHGGRRARVRGQTKVDADFNLLAAAQNLARLAVLGIQWTTLGWVAATA